MTKVRDADRLWVYRAVVTQANAAGGAIVLDITPGAGNYIELVSALISNSGTNSIGVREYDSANNAGPVFVVINSAAATYISLPNTGSLGTATANVASLLKHGTYGTDYLSIYQTGAGVQNDTMTVHLRAYCRSAPTVSKARSTNQANVTIAEAYNEVIVP